MITLGKLRYLDIDKESFNFIYSNSGLIDYQKWINYIEANKKTFVWKEDTEYGKGILKRIDTVPVKIQNDLKDSLNKVRCYAKFNAKKNDYDISATCDKKKKRVFISFERRPKIDGIKIFLDMANHLDALLLYRGNHIIDEKVIAELERQEEEKKKARRKQVSK